MAPELRNFVYASFLRYGRAPTWVDVMHKFNMSKIEAMAALHEAADDHDIVFLPKQNGAPSSSILMAHPFSNIPTCHVAVLDARAVQEAIELLDPGSSPRSEHIDPFRRYAN
eukprot:TRINITY_DN49439_c0_g1_i1.p2 TRINITY_DN49439_c0_g1~~TRINITY_DN49439_c0_g1_i1.p2  ORF type:complete len:112 (+),score=18.56 TRINITY_DN49439_c0_g1_i1:54-389(+)